MGRVLVGYLAALTAAEMELLRRRFWSHVDASGADMCAKGRDRHPSGDDSPMRRRPELRLVGERNPRAKLRATDVLVIRQRVAGGETRRAVAADYGVTDVMVSNIVNRKAWTHV